jgi:hypothetical protein
MTFFKILSQNIKARFSRKWRNLIGKISDLWWVLSLLILVLWWIWWVNISNKINIIEQKIDWNTAEATLLSYFSEIENNNLTGAYNLLSEEFKQQWNSYEWFYNRLYDIVGFEWLQITELTWKNTAIQKVFLVEFEFKKRWKIPLDSKRWMYVRYKNWKREINANSILYDNKWRSSTSCEFYTFEHCK